MDMHSHSVSSDDSRATVEQYLKWIQVLRKRGYTIAGIVLTEHRKFDLNMDYSSLAQEYGVLVLKGSELDTNCGHILVYGVTERLLNEVDFSDVTMSAVELMDTAKVHGATAIPAHPGRIRIGLCEFVDQGILFPNVTIVETLNGGSRSGENERALHLAEASGYRRTGGSDAHLASSIATCLTAFDTGIHNEGELVEALLYSEYTPVLLEDTLNNTG